MTTTTTQHQLTDHDAIRRFILGGKATFTVKNTQTGRRFTFRVECKRDLVKNGRGVKSPYFVSLMTGSDNESSYSYFGYIRTNDNADGYKDFVHGGRKAKVPENAGPVAAFRWLWTLINGRNSDGSKRSNTLADYPSVEFWHEGHCCCCGRLLTVPESIATGIGPICAGWY